MQQVKRLREAWERSVRALCNGDPNSLVLMYAEIQAFHAYDDAYRALTGKGVEERTS